MMRYRWYLTLRDTAVDLTVPLDSQVLMCPMTCIPAERRSLPAVCAQDDPRFAELVENVGVAVRYFNDAVERARAAGGWEWSVDKVLNVIKGAHARVHRCPFLRAMHACREP